MEPITRKEMFLAKAGGQDVTTPTPVTREEYFLNEIAKGGGSGGVLVVGATVSGSTMTLDKTWQEIYDAQFAVISAAFGESTKRFMFVCRVEADNVYSVYAFEQNGDAVYEYVFDTNTASGYPSATRG